MYSITSNKIVEIDEKICFTLKKCITSTQELPFYSLKIELTAENGGKFYDNFNQKETEDFLNKVIKYRFFTDNEKNYDMFCKESDRTIEYRFVDKKTIIKLKDKDNNKLSYHEVSLSDFVYVYANSNILV